jgi:hypothetical protein
MAYKVLGQTTSVASSTASTTTNLVRDPSFRNLIGSNGWIDRTMASFVYNTGNSANFNYNYNINNNAHWGFSHSTVTNKVITNSGNNGITTAPFGNSKTAIGMQNGGTTSNWILTYGTAEVSIATPAANWLNTATAIPVSGGLTYYGYASAYTVSAISGALSFSVFYFDSSGGYISSTNVDFNLTAGSWVRGGGSHVAPANARWANFQIYTNSSNANNSLYLDGIYFGLDQTPGSTFVEPLLPGEAATTAPFTSKIAGYQLETPVSTTGTAPAGTQTVLYTVPAGKSTVVSTISVANLNSVPTTYRIAVIPSGETLATKHFTHMDVLISANTTHTVTVGMTLTAGDKIQIAADTSTVAFTAFGDER